ncbi:MAG: hypothetical protein M4579_006174 [Chaenotheca gracillima]|nr:MAG: hypothetical protein M4579_006174 [Chaenotheca gracillima]
MPPKPPSTSFFALPPPFLLPTRPLLHRTNPHTVPTRSIKSISTPIPTRFSKGQGLPTLGASSTAALARKANTLPLRTGALAIKKGMTGVYDTTTGRRSPCTVLQLDRVQVVSHKTRMMHGYYAVQVGSGVKEVDAVTKPELGHFAAHGVGVKRHLAEFRVKSEDGLLGVGEMITPTWFREGQFVDARANTKGKGFAGGMKRHGFKGQGASHGVSLTHRAMGSAGPSQGGGSRVYPGKKMAGRMGGQRHTVQNLKVIKVDEENGIVVVNGCVSGPNNGVVMIQDAIKKPWPEIPAENPPSPGNITEPLREMAKATA